jgi:apolipoprotein N-acyltransferase
LLINLPPIGWFSIVSPWTATGLWFPSHGWLGIALGLLTCAAMTCVLIWPRRMKTWAWLVIAGSYLAPVHAREFVQTGAEMIVHAVQTRWGEARLDSASQYQRAINFTQMEKTIPKDARLVIWPEMAIGQWSARTQYWLSDQSSQGPATGQTWLVGAAIERAGNWTNGFLLWESKKSPVFIDGRIPMPIGMWRPGAFSFSPWADSVVTIDGAKVGVSICYEDLLPWAAWQLHFQSVDRVVSLSSMWFAQDMHLNRNLAHSAQAWSRLFGVPYARSVNF